MIPECLVVSACGAVLVYITPYKTESPMSLYNPRIDFAFKKLFGSEANQDILLAFINSILNTDPPIEQIQRLNPYQPGSLPRDKTVILDVRAQDTAGR